MLLLKANKKRTKVGLMDTRKGQNDIITHQTNSLWLDVLKIGKTTGLSSITRLYTADKLKRTYS